MCIYDKDSRDALFLKAIIRALSQRLSDWLVMVISEETFNLVTFLFDMHFGFTEVEHWLLLKGG